MQTQLKDEKESPKRAERKKPVWETQVGAFSAAIWENEREINGKMLKIRSLALSKRYKGRDGEFKTTTIYPTENEVPKAIVALKRGYEELVVHEEAE